MKRCPLVPLQPFSFAALFPADLYYCACVVLARAYLTIPQVMTILSGHIEIHRAPIFFLLPHTKHVVEGVFSKL